MLTAFHKEEGLRKLCLDAIIIANNDDDSLSGSSPSKLTLDERTADIQVVLNFLENQGSIKPPIEGDGTASWSSSLRLNGIFLYSYLANSNFTVELINNYTKEKDTFISLLEQSPRAIIISTSFIYSKPQLNDLIKDIRSLAPDTFIIAGGPFVYLSYLIFKRSSEPIFDIDEIKNDFLFFNREEPSVDLYIISPRGENILSDTLRRLKQNRQMDDLPNLARFTGNSYYFTNRIDDLSGAENISVDWHSLPDRVFESSVIPLQASTGCPHKCAFCNFTKDSRLLSVKPLDYLMNELKMITDRGGKYIWFVDDNFRLGKNDLNSVAQRIIDEGLQIHWMSFIRVDTLQSADFELLRKSGCHELQLGLESADPQILLNMNKKIVQATVADVIKELLTIGINCSCYFVIGFPGETEETVARTRDFIKSIEFTELDGTLSWSLYPFMLAPMSPIYEYDMRKKYKLTGYMHNWKHETMNSGEARDHVKNILLEIEKSGPMYRGDNQLKLEQLTPEQRNKFIIRRHELSRRAIQNKLEKNEIIGAFREVLDA